MKQSITALTCMLFAIALLAMVLPGCASRNQPIDMTRANQATLRILTTEPGHDYYDVIEVSDYEHVQKLSSYFHEIAQGKYDKPEGTVKPLLVVTFDNGIEAPFRVTSDYRVWTWGNAKRPVVGDLAAYVEELRIAYQ